MPGPLILILSTGTARIEKHLEGPQLDSYSIGRGTDATLFLNDPGISRKHCRIYAADGALLIEDTGSSGGTWLNGERLSAPARLADGDEVRIGGVSIEVRLEAERVAAAAEATMATPPPPRRCCPPRRAAANPDATLAIQGGVHASNDLLMAGPADGLLASTDSQDILIELNRDCVVIGRDDSSDVALDNLMISRQHLRLRRVDGEVLAEDLGSTNGTFLNGHRLTEPHRLAPGDTLAIGPYCLTFDGSRLVSERPDMGAEIGVRGLCHEVIDRETGRPKMLLSDITLTIRPREFVGLLGTSGAGKSTFVGAVSGRRPGTHGKVLLNGENLYTRFDAFKAGIGFVPQDVIFHDTLPLIEALRFTSRLRLSKDASDEEIEANIERVLKTVGLTENRATIIKNLSGGQKKRVSIAMELLSQPRVLFLDEVTSGLDPRTEKQMMKLFRELADSGITVICITHYANSVEICDQIIYLNKGLLTFYGSPARYKQYFEVEQIEAAYDKEEHKTPAEWQAEFRKSAAYEDGVAGRDTTGTAVHTAKRAAQERQQIDWSQVRRQLGVFTSRYIRVLSIDRRNLMLLLGLPPLTAVLLCILSSSMEVPTIKEVFNRESYQAWMHKQNILCFGPIISMFLLSMFGSVREIVKELSIYHHERFINLRIVPYLLSKAVPLAVIGAIQTLSVILIINGFADMKAGSIISQFFTLFLVSMCGMLAGLAISASVKSSDWAVMLMIGVVIPQLLFAGALVPVRGVSAFIGKGFISGYWALEALRTSVEDHYISNHVGSYLLPGRSQGWGFGTSMLLLHVVAFALLTFFLMAKKDGPGVLQRIGRSLGLLYDDLRERLPARSVTQRVMTLAGSPGGPKAVKNESKVTILPDDSGIKVVPAVSMAGGAQKATMNKATVIVVSMFFGAVVGYPISYFFQPGLLRAFMSLGSYIAHIGDVLGDKNLAGTAIGTCVASIIAFPLLGLLLVAVTSRKDSKP